MGLLQDATSSLSILGGLLGCPPLALVQGTLTAASPQAGWVSSEQEIVFMEKVIWVQSVQA